MLHSNLVLLSTAAIVMGAGVMVGRVTAEYPREQQHQQHDRFGSRSRDWIDDQLSLTADQKQKMDAIWDATRKKMEATFDGRHASDHAREQAILNLLTPDQRTAYAKINDQFRAKRDDQFKQRSLLVQKANEASRALLDENQQKKWDALTKTMRDRQGHFGGFEEHSTTKPTDSSAGGNRASVWSAQ
jgi:Spy/CpxP family protein refolding chaperone